MPALGATDLFDGTAVNAGAVTRVPAGGALAQLMTPSVASVQDGMVILTWVVVGFTPAIGGGSAWPGGLRFVGLASTNHHIPGFSGRSVLAVPPVRFALFQPMSAVSTPAFRKGVTAEYRRFASFVAFAAYWVILDDGTIVHRTLSPLGRAARWAVTLVVVAVRSFRPRQLPRVGPAVDARREEASPPAGEGL